MVRKMKRIMIAFGAYFIVSMSPVSANSLDESSFQTIGWRGFPIRISVIPNQERIIDFGEAVQWSLPNELIGMVQGQSIAGKMYFTALTEFPNTRFHFRSLDSGVIYILDITGTDDGESSPLRVINALNEGTNNGGLPVNKKAEVTVGYAELSQYAFQEVYAPDRLVKKPNGVHNVNLRSNTPLKRLIPNAEVTITPMAQWKTKRGLYATALFVKNTENRVVQIDPRNIRSDPRWKALSMINGVLSPVNTIGDTTTLVVVSEGSWSEVSKWLR